MPEKHGFFDSTESDIREYTASDYADYFNMFFNSGIANVDGKVGLKVTGNGMKAIVDTGFALIKGYYYKNDIAKELIVDTADTILNRIDRVVLKLDLSARTINAYIKKGTFSSSPAAPALQRDSTVYEISLAKLIVNAKATSVSTADERFDKAVCGQIEVAANVPLEQMWNTFNVGFGDIKNTWNAWFQARQNDLGVRVTVGKAEPSGLAIGDLWLKELT